MQIKIDFLIKIVLFSLGMLTSALLVLSDSYIPYGLFLVPLTYSFLIIFFPSMTKYLFSHLGVTILNITMLLRYVISPLLNSIYGVSVQNGITPSQDSYTLAIYLIIFEMITVFILFSLFHKKFYINNVNRDLIKKTNITGWLYVIFCVFLIVIFPGLLDRYTFILTAETLESKELEIDVISMIPLFLQMGSMVIMVSLLNVFFKKYIKNHSGIFVFLSIVSVIFISSFIIGTSRFSIILPLVTGLYVVYLIYVNYRKVIASISIVVMFIYVIISTYLKSQTLNSATETISSTFQGLNSDLQLYFSGITNVAVAIETSNIYNSFQISSILADLTRNIVFINRFFTDNQNIFELFNLVYYNGGIQRDQILPMIGQGYLYFGFILAPVLTAIALLVMMYLDSKSVQTESIFTKFVFSYVTLKFGLLMMANFSNLLSFFVNQFLLLVIIFWFNNLLLKKRGNKIWK